MFRIFLTVAISRSLRGMVGVALQYLVVVVGHLPAHVWQAPVAHLNCIPVYDWV